MVRKLLLGWVFALALSQGAVAGVYVPPGAPDGTFVSNVLSQTLVGNVAAQSAAISALQTAIPPTFTYLTTGTGTFTPQTTTINFTVQVVGGGGGGSGSGITPGNGTTGTASTFGPATANPGAFANALAGGTGGACALTATTGWSMPVPVTGQAGSPGASGYTFTVGAKGGGIGGNLASPSANGVAGQANTGGGGSGGGVDAGANAGAAGGGEGARCFYANSNVTGTYSWAVGTGGTAGAAGTMGKIGGVGGTGAILVAEYAR